MRKTIAVGIVLCLCVGLSRTSLCQRKSKISYLDSLDHKFDMSDILIDAKGFIPVPIIVTEPALGGLGGGIVPVFITKRPPAVSRGGKRMRTPPM